MLSMCFVRVAVVTALGGVVDGRYLAKLRVDAVCLGTRTELADSGAGSGWPVSLSNSRQLQCRAAYHSGSGQERTVRSFLRDHRVGGAVLRCMCRWRLSVFRSADRDQLRAAVGLIQAEIASPLRPTVRDVKAALVAEYGGPDVLKLKEAPTPDPGRGQVSIDVAYAGVNYAEVMARRGDLASFVPPFIPGLEVSGFIRACGDGVRGLSVGQPVSALTSRGGYAEVAVAPASVTYPLVGGSDADLVAGAAFPTIVPTAWALIREVARVHRGESVLVHAAAGGVGTLAGQIARLVGAGAVLGVTSTPQKAEYARNFGFDEVFTGRDWIGQVRQATGGRGVDVALESIGGLVREQTFALLAPLGRLVVFGNASGSTEAGVSGSVLRAEVKATLGWSITALAAANPQRVRQIAVEAVEAVTRGDLRVDVTEIVSLAEASDAHSLLESRTSVGKLLLEVA